VFAAGRNAPRRGNEVIDHFLKQRVVVHRVDPFRWDYHGQEPVVRVLLAASFEWDVGESEDGRRQRNQSRRKTAGRDRGSGCRRRSDNGGGSRAEGFGEFSGSVRGENFVNGDLAFFGWNTHLAKQS